MAGSPDLFNHLFGGMARAASRSRPKQLIVPLTAMKRKLATVGARACCQKRRAFSLIELLIVIAIIAILAAMLLPALSSAKAHANSAACKNHLHQIGLALQMYVTDGDKYPPFQQWSPPMIRWPTAELDPGYKTSWWFQLLEPYYTRGWWTNTSYHCPGYKFAVNNRTGQEGVPSLEGFPVGSYGYNWIGASSRFGNHGIYGGYGLGGLANGPWDLDVPRSAVPQSRVLAPAEMFAIADSRLPFWMSGPEAPMGAPMIDVGFNTLALPLHMLSDPPRHGRNDNVLCCNGHVDSMPPHLLFNPTNSAVRWNSDHQEHPEAW